MEKMEEKLGQSVSKNLGENLHQKFVRLGMMKARLTNEMAAMLPAIYRSGIYKKYAPDIFEYAGRYGKIGRTTVGKRLKLEKHLVDKPFLKESIKKVGVHKVAFVASLATAETDRAFADKVENMSKSALETLAKELRSKEKLGDKGGNQQQFEDSSDVLFGDED